MASHLGNDVGYVMRQVTLANPHLEARVSHVQLICGRLLRQVTYLFQQLNGDFALPAALVRPAQLRSQCKG